MKKLSLWAWATQFGFSVTVPLCALLLLGSWLKDRWGLGPWVLLLCLGLGIGTGVAGAVRILRKLRNDCDGGPTAFHEHE